MIGPRCAAILLYLTLLVPAAGCEETLPAYEMPLLPLQARIEVQDVDLGELLVKTPGPFYVYVFNISDGIDQYTLPPPYEVKASINVSLATDPSRKILLEEEAAFSTPSDSLFRGRSLYLSIPFPLKDSEGRPWNWQRYSQLRHELIFQGKVIVEQNGEKLAELNTPQERASIIYEATPGNTLI